VKDHKDIVSIEKMYKKKWKIKEKTDNIDVTFEGSNIKETLSLWNN